MFVVQTYSAKGKRWMPVKGFKAHTFGCTRERMRKLVQVAGKSDTAARFRIYNTVSKEVHAA